MLSKKATTLVLDLLREAKIPVVIRGLAAAKLPEGTIRRTGRREFRAKAQPIFDNWRWIGAADGSAGK